MLIASRRLIKSVHDFSADLRNNNDLDICKEWVYKNFYLPKNTRYIYFEVYDKPTKDRFSFSVMGGFSALDFDARIYSHEGKRRKILICYVTLRKWFTSIGLKPDKIYYAGIQYEIK